MSIINGWLDLIVDGLLSVVSPVPKRWYYHGDGIDDYFSLQPIIQIRTGNVITFKFRAPIARVKGTDPILGQLNASNQLVVGFKADGKMYANRCTFTIDGISGDVYPTDGKVYTGRVTGTAYGSFTRVLADASGRYNSLQVWDVHIKDSDQGELFYPLDDGYRADGLIRETVQGKNGELKNGQQSGWLYEELI